MHCSLEMHGACMTPTVGGTDNERGQGEYGCIIGQEQDEPGTGSLYCSWHCERAKTLRLNFEAGF